MMSSAVAFHTKGPGSRFQCSAQVMIAAVSAATPRKAPRRRRLSVSFLNQRPDEVQPGTRGRREVQVPAATVPPPGS